MISNKLLSEVLKQRVITIDVNKSDILTTIMVGDVPYRKTINIYELAHKCKEWARDNDYHITSGNRTDGTTRYDVMCAWKDCDIEDWDDFFSGMFDTEPEAIFQACEWIMKQKEV